MALSFSQRCYHLLLKVPKGEITTYKALAHALHSRAYRAVGKAMNKNPHAPQVPCHRVINASGKLGGYASGIKRKMQLLKNEGVKIVNKKIDVDKYGYIFK